MNREDQIYHQMKAEWEASNDMRFPHGLVQLYREKAKAEAAAEVMEATGVEPEANGIDMPGLSVPATSRLFKHLEHYGNCHR
jgi:hypothetical protein